MSKSRRRKLEEALAGPTIGKFSSPYEPGSTIGYVLNIGPKFLLLGFIDDHIRFNGYQCLRVCDVKKLKVPSPNAEFMARALTLRHESIERKPDIDLSDVGELLRSASLLFPLITIHQEEINRDTCKIGKVMEIRGNVLRFLEIDPDAVWEKRPTKIYLSDITRVDFGGEYEGALHLVGGDPALGTNI